jgi:TPR repeat protein
LQAAAWFRKAAEQGDAGAQAQLGISYTLGQGVAQNDGQAFQWLSKAAEHGEGSGMLFLGTAYALGKGTARDNVQAHKWSSLAILRLRDPSLRDRAIALRDTVAGGLTPTQLAEAQRLAAAWQPR